MVVDRTLINKHLKLPTKKEITQKKATQAELVHCDNISLSEKLEKASQNLNLFKKIIGKSLFCERCCSLQNEDFSKKKLYDWQKSLQKIDKFYLVDKIFKKIHIDSFLIIVLDVNDIMGSYPDPKVIDKINRKKVCL